MSDFKSNDPVFGALSPADHETVMRMIRKGVSRRDFMGFMMAAGATTAAASAMFTSASKAWADTPKMGGKLIMAGDQHGPNDTLDPQLFTSAVDYFRGRMFYGSLTRLTSDLSYEPELAEEILSNDDATQWTFKLRRGVEFHDGKTFTADDALYTLNRHTMEGTVSNANGLVQMVESWEKVNDYEIRANLSSPNADLPIALGTFHFKIVQDGTTDFSNPVGTGPYRVAEFKPGVRARGTKFENYWTEGGYLDEIEHFGIGDPVARLNAFMNGDIDAMVNLSPKSIPTVEAADGKEVWSLESSAYINLACRFDNPASSDIDMITGMKYLMDRQRLAKGVFKGQATLGNDQPIGPAYFDHCPDIPQRQLDPEKAKFHFDKSGIGNTPIPIVVAEVAPGAVEQALFLQREAQKIGVNIDVQKVTTDGYWGAVWLKAPICAVSWNMRPTANIMMSIAFKGDAAWNETAYQNPEFDELLVRARGITDPAERRQAYCDLQTIIHEKNGSIIPVYRNYIDAAASHVQGRTTVPLNNFGGAESPLFLWRA